MFVDIRDVPDGTGITADICIVGAGAAGITLAREFNGTGIACALLEGGGTAFEDKSQELYAGDSIGRPILDLTTCRLRYFGGTTNHWAGWCLPLDAIDFETRDGVPYRGWPFGLFELYRWYRRAQDVCQLGPFDYVPEDWGIVPTNVPAPFRGPHFIPKIVQLSPPTRFALAYGPELQSSPNITVFLHATACRFETNDGGSEVESVSVRTLSGRGFKVAAKVFVVAAGGIENARLLLASGATEGDGIGLGRNLIGRFFMTHINVSAGLVAVTDPPTDFYFDPGYFRGYRNGSVTRPFVPFVGLSEATMRQRQLPNIKLLWEYQPPRGLSVGGALPALHSILHDVEERPDHVTGKIFRREGVLVSGPKIFLNLEPIPNPDSRVQLAPERDALGMRRVAVDWHVTAADKRNGKAVLRLLGAEMARTGFGRLRSFLEDGDDAKWPADMYGDQHHIGTTRMHRDPSLGVVNEDCRVHGIANLYVAGSSVFPTAGAANPTLTITALALRLADHLKEVLK
ncbi:MAG TPA: GMC family oxidoreductase [Stellaceae bacterium]|nr:GMC family oxidoreductase [Stellaceae bacterium]